jgi:hypothetical protein
MKQLLQILLSKTNLTVKELDGLGLLGLYFEQMGLVYLGKGDNAHVYRFQDNTTKGQPVMQYTGWSMVLLTKEEKDSFVDGLLAASELGVPLKEATHEKTS